MVDCQWDNYGDAGCTKEDVFPGGFGDDEAAGEGRMDLQRFSKAVGCGACEPLNPEPVAALASDLAARVLDYRAVAKTRTAGGAIGGYSFPSAVSAASAVSTTVCVMAASCERGRS